jgi:ketosteroid isomerase-like protein
MVDGSETAVRAWLAEMEACVRAEDYARCRAIFAADVVAFGTRGARLVGLEALERDQWRRVWGTIRNFTFQTDQLAWGAAGDLLWLACPWTSEGHGPDGATFSRPGRMTAVLERRGGRWVAVHTHHSLKP